MVDDLLGHDTTDLTALVRDRVVSPRELIDACLRRIEAVEPVVNACCAVFDEEARVAAAAAERALVVGEPVGPLHGIPVAVKESIWIGGKRSTSGSRVYADFVAPEDAVAVARLRAAGAIVLVQTTMPELGTAGHTASELFGITRNPWNPERTPGGSSGGSGAVVAAHGVPLALGTDGGGSIRKPAAFCGIAGIKPTFGRIPAAAGLRSQSLVVLGPMARSARDLALALGVLAGSDPRDPSCLPVPATDVLAEVDGALSEAPRIAWSADLGVVALEPSIRAGFASAVSRLSELDWPQDEATPPGAEISELTWRILLAEAGRLPAGREHLIRDPEALDVFERASGMLAVDAQQARIERGQLARAWEEFFTRYDLLVTPTVGFEPPPADAEQARNVWQDYASAFALTAAANLTGQPAVTIPAGITASRLPYGIQVTGPRGADARCLAAALTLERVLQFPQPPIEALPALPAPH